MLTTTGATTVGTDTIVSTAAA